MADRDCMSCHGAPTSSPTPGQASADAAGRHGANWRTRATPSRLRAVPHRLHARRWSGPARRSSTEGGLLHLPRRGRRPPTRRAPTASSPPRAAPTRRPAATATARTASSARARPHRPPTRATSRPLRQLPPHGREGGRALQGHGDGDRRALRREHPRQGAARERPDRHRDLRRLPHRARRAAASDPASTVNRGERRQDLRPVPPRHLRAVQNSIHSPTVSKSKEKLPDCTDCHSAHSIRRTDADRLPAARS